MRTLLAGFSLLTVIPLPGFRATERDLQRCVWSFPLVGVFAGLLLYLAGCLLCRMMPQTVLAAVMTLLPEALTRAFHLDGLADSADGLLSSRPRERKLEIMRDSHIGSMGVFAIGAVLLLKFAAYCALPPCAIPVAAAMAAFAARCNITVYIAISRYARKEGMAKLLFERRHIAAAGFALLLLLWTSVLLLGALSGMLLTATLTVGVLLWRQICTMTLGGATGDTIGACEEMSETLLLLLWAAVPVCNGGALCL